MKPVAPAPFVHAGFSGLIGVGRGDITPPVGINHRNWGAARQDVAEGIHRPLTITALTLQANEKDSPFVLVASDLGWWQNLDDEWFVRGGLIETLSLDPSRVMMNLAHSHAGPAISRDHADRKGGEFIVPYLGKVREALITATRHALHTRATATLSWSHGKCNLATNRDLPDPSKPRIVCGFNPGNKADDTVLVGRVTNRGGRILATVVNYACHPTTLAWDNRLISPDYVGAMREVVEAETSGAPCLFLQGASGELSPREQYLGDTAVADSHGRHLGYSVMAVLEGMLPHETSLSYTGTVESGAPLAIWQRAAQKPSTSLTGMQLNVEVPLKKLPSLEEIDAELKTCEDRVMRERLTRKRHVSRIVGSGPTTLRRVWIWRLGDAFVVGQSDEAYSLLQTELRRIFPDHPVVVMNLVNGACGYLAPQEHYEHDIYQVWQSPFARGCLEAVVKACEGAMRKMSAR